MSGFGVPFRLVILDERTVLKRPAGRPKDLAIVAELQGIPERRKAQSDQQQRAPPIRRRNEQALP